MGTKSLVALDVNHIKQYVFATGKLKEIRGASSRLDRFNRNDMGELAWRLDAQVETIFANGGSGLFLMETAQTKTFIEQVQQKCREITGDAASVTCVTEPLPLDAPQNVSEILTFPLKDTLALLRYRLQMAKGYPPQILAQPSHPFLLLCHSCGVLYAEGKDDVSDTSDSDEEDQRFCQSCLLKREEDMQIKKDITNYTSAVPYKIHSPLWRKLLKRLKELNYDFPVDVERPYDLNVFQGATKNYIGLIYADANSMGKKLEKISRLDHHKTFADTIDNALYEAVATAIKKHLAVEKFGLVNPDKTPAFPFDILMLGGDDVIIVTPASIALQVAQTIAEQFYTLTNREHPLNTAKDLEKHTLSVGVVLAPIKYPFSALQTLADDTLKAAKKSSSKVEVSKVSDYGETRINFMVVTGSTSLSYQKTYQELHRKNLPHNNPDQFYATLRPYTLDQLATLLDNLKQGNQVRLGRTKLHQLREAILKRNRTTTILEALASLRNWKHNEREFIEGLVDTWGKRSPQQRHTETLFPWYREPGTEHIYRTPLLDFIELYDFVVAEGIDTHEPS